MLVAPIKPAGPVPAEALFPSWRGREPYKARLNRVREALFGAHAGLDDAVAALPFDHFEAACDVHLSVHKYNEVPAAAAASVEALSEELRAPWLCALMLWHIERFDEAFAASGLPGEFALHYADAFHRILDQIGKDPGFADLAKDSFLKDLWLARAVMIPAFAQVWWPRSGLSARDVLRAGPAASAYVFLRCGGRRPFLEGHTHDPVARAYWNEHGWGEALRLAALALPALSELRGAFGTAWFYDPKVREISPRISFAQDLQVGRGAFRLEVGSNDAAIANATATSAERRNRYRDGLYLPTDYSIVWSRKDLIEAYGP
ncbi:MAG TPA: hypothetical protein VFW19_18005 [Allosphingosinicella sp.]|nr:hypothetical protein [Allosphingosinicella sp.]